MMRKSNFPKDFPICTLSAMRKSWPGAALASMRCARRSRSFRRSAPPRLKCAAANGTPLPRNICRNERRVGRRPSFPGRSIHDSSYVDDPVRIGAGTVIWHFCHVLGDVSIGKDCSIGQNVMIGPNVTIGDGCKIQNNVSLYRRNCARGRCILRSKLRVHQCRQSARIDFAQSRIQDHARHARRHDRRQRNRHLRSYDWPLCLRRGRGGGDEGCFEFCIDGWGSGTTHRMDESCWRAAWQRSRLPARRLALP